MSHLTAKNQLQEIYQKQKLSLPIYTHIKVENGWVSTVSLHDGTQITGTPRKKKTEADIAVATTILNKYKYITNKPPNSPPLYEPIKKPIVEVKPKSLTVDRTMKNLTKKIALLVDLENLPNLITDAISVIEGFHIYAFVGEHHPLATKIDSKSTVNYIISPSTRKDGTDTCMQIVVGMMLANEMFDHYMIGTRDHFGGALVDLITTPIVVLPNGKVDLNFNNTMRSAKLVTTLDHIMNELEKLKK
jgi:hypothetical protein